jgi:transglutaminase-like putative cysteine protease
MFLICIANSATMKLTAIKLFALLILFPFSVLQGQNKGVRTGAEPGWVTRNPVHYTMNSLDDEADDGYVDLMYEKQVSLIQPASFYKKAIKIISEAGVQNSSKISISFDPSYQDLCFHSIRIVRGSQTINKLQLSRIKTIQQETELDRFIYNGSLTAVLVLDDVRKGDVIEYSYTIKGMNPIFGDKYSDMYDVRFTVPVYQLYYKLVTPKERPVTIKNSQVAISPVVSSTAKDVTYEWKQENLSSLYIEDDLPSWYDPYPMIMVSEFKSWQEVNNWALRLFPFNVPLSAALQNQVAEIKKKHTNPENRILAALRFVQDDVRYMGIEMGVNSHQPHSPAQVLSQRFGDCKDKSYLLCTLLRAMGIEASPVFINTTYKKTIGNWLPSAKAFDHTTVRVKLNGSFYFFDPTISYQRGSLQDISFPDYQVGLVITDTTTGLTSIPLQEKGMVKVKEVFNVRHMGGSAQLIVTTRYTGSYADDVRSVFQNSSIYEKRKDYEDYYSDYIDKIKADSLDYIDDEQTGAFTTIEHYTVSDFWGTSTALKKASFQPYVIDGIIKKPKEQDRTMPFYQVFPARYEEEIEINLPEPWNIKDESEEVNGPGFIVSYHYKCIGKRIKLQYAYENLKDHVLPGEASAFFASMKRANESLGYTITQTIEDSSITSTASGSMSNAYTSLYIVLGLCVFITIMVRRGRH